VTDYRDVEDHERLGIFLTNLLDSVVATFESYEIDLPERRYVCLGLPAYDCEQVTVSLVQLYFGPPGQQTATPQRCDGPITAVVAVQILRKIPIGNTRGDPPRPDDISTSTVDMVTDAFVLLRSINGLDPFEAGVIADVSAAEPQGGYDGPVLTLTLAIP
jgi:hypothetical protein